MGILDTIFGGSDGSDAALDAIYKNRDLLDQIALPEYEEYVPELYSSESANYETVSEDPLIRSAQLQALERMAGLAETGLSDADAADFERARQEGTQVARGARDAALNDARARGVAGSGLEMAMREAGIQSGAQRTQNAGLETAGNAARQRALYQTAYGDALSQQRSDDNRINSQNTSIINQFNRENTNQRNQTNAQNVAAKNDAFQYNQGLQDRDYRNKMDRAGAYSGINNQISDVQMARGEANRKKRQGMTGAIGAGLGYMAGGTTGASVGYGVGSSL